MIIEITREIIQNFKIINSKEPISHDKNVKIGPLWMGKLHKKRVIMELRTILSEKRFETKNLLWKIFDLYEEEADAEAFFYSTEDLSSYFKKSAPRLESIIEQLKSKKINVSKTHFTPTGFKTNALIDEIKKIF